MMQTYDLEKALRNSDEYSRLRGLYDQVNADESAKRMFDNFRNVQSQLQSRNRCQVKKSLRKR